MKRADCPFCEEIISLPGKIFEGKQVRCSYCGEFVEVVNISPVELDYSNQFDDDDDLFYNFDYDN